MPTSSLGGRTTPRTSSGPVEKSAGGRDRSPSVSTAASITSDVMTERGAPPTPLALEGGARFHEGNLSTQYPKGLELGYPLVLYRRFS